MGCNTSKETVPQVDNENADGNEEKAKDPVESTKTQSATSNGAVVTGGDAAADKQESINTDEQEEAELKGAATKIQAVFRGHQARKSMKQPEKQEEAEQTPEQLQEEFRSDDVELCHAATKIQASFRGHMIRKQQMEKKEDEPVSKDKKNQNEEEEELDIDLSDPDLNKAAVKIQASFRGHMVRKEHEEEGTNKPN